MPSLLEGVLLVLAILPALLVAVLVTPIKLGFSATTSPTWRVKIAARLFAGLTPEILIHDSQRRLTKRKQRAAKKSRRTAKSHQNSVRRARAIAAAPRLVVGLLRPIHLQHLRMDADIGLADPADTGQLLGFLSALKFSLPSPSPVSIAIRPDLSGPCASGAIEAQLSFVPAAFLPPGVRFAWHVFGSNS